MQSDIKKIKEDNEVSVILQKVKSVPRFNRGAPQKKRSLLKPPKHKKINSNIIGLS
jgi:hypothetical protein